MHYHQGVFYKLERLLFGRKSFQDVRKVRSQEGRRNATVTQIITGCNQVMQTIGMCESQGTPKNWFADFQYNRRKRKCIFTVLLWFCVSTKCNDSSPLHDEILLSEILSSPASSYETRQGPLHRQTWCLLIAFYSSWNWGFIFSYLFPWRTGCLQWFFGSLHFFVTPPALYSTPLEIPKIVKHCCRGQRTSYRIAVSLLQK